MEAPAVKDSSKYEVSFYIIYILPMLAEPVIDKLADFSAISVP
jgi:hypothetical protein